ncbi:hypothetical protein EUTSA_v10000690mg, partial [Eutrema salsugineum]
MMMQKWRRSGDFIRFGCKSLSNLRSKENSMSRSVSGFVNRSESTKGKIFEPNAGNYHNTELDHPCLGRNLGIMQQYKCFGSSSASKVQRNFLFSTAYVIINVGLMNKVLAFDEVSGVLVCEAGCILENLATFLDTKGFVMPLDLGAKGSCHIGGNVSTNAGGLRLIRYGSLHGTVLGLEAVTANGNVLDMLGTLRKDNTGYDLKHLFIGSEGSLGIVTKVSILTQPKMSSVNLAFIACKDFLSCQKLLVEAKRNLGEILSAFEFLDNNSMDLVLNHLDGVRNPVSSPENFYILIETTGSGETYDREKLEAFLLKSLEKGLVSDGVIAQDINQASSFWRIRE